jgi:cell division septation protein DedD
MQPTIVIPPQATGKDKKRIPLVWIPATLSVGLLIAAVYLGGRIVTAHRLPAQPVARIKNVVTQAPQLPVAHPVITTPVIATVVKPEVQPAVKPDVKPELTSRAALGPVPVIEPRAGEFYIQLGALNQEATTRFVQHLRSNKLEPRVAPGPRPEILRVLIGPFDNRDAVNERKAQLQAEGFDTFVRRY